MKKIQCTIKGQSALLMHAYSMQQIEALDKKPPEEQAEYAAYRDPDTKVLYIPGLAIQRSFVGSATYSKGKGRGSLQKPVAACVSIFPERCSLNVKDYIIDSRAVVMPTTKGRVVRYRPRLDNWQVSFEIEYDENLLTESQLRRVVDDAGTRVGLLDFRPEHKGPFGRFMVIDWKNI